MTDKEEQTSDNNIEEQESQPAEPSSTDNDDLDIEGALAAVASLQDLTREAEPEVDEEADDEIEDESEEEDSPDIQEFERVDDDKSESLPVAEGTADSELMDSTASYDTVFPRPPASVLHRGQMASVVPAILLIGIGAYLTFIVTASEAALQPSVIVAVLIGGLGAMLLAQWISTARWAIGSFFIGVLLLLTGATATYLALPNNLSLMDGYPLLLTAIGTSFVITDIFVPSGRRIWLIGLILAIAGLIGLATTTTIAKMSIAGTIGGLLPLAIIIIVILLIAPVFRRRQQ